MWPGKSSKIENAMLRSLAGGIKQAAAYAVICGEKERDTPCQAKELGNKGGRPAGKDKCIHTEGKEEKAFFSTLPPTYVVL